jgi:SulP family sulfate permease
MAHIKPPVALHAAWVVGLICTLLGGRSGMVNGAEGAYAAIIGTFIAVPDTPGQNGAGVQTLFPSVMCAGAFMLIIWAVGGDRFVTLMAASIMDGFCCGLAIVIGLSQLHPFQVGHGADSHWRAGDDPTTWFMVLIMICSMLTMEFVPKIPWKAAKLLPSSLLAILVAILIEYAIVRFIPCPASSAHDVSHRRLYADSDDWLDGMQKPLVGVGADGRRLAETNVTYCGTDVIGDVTPFSLTYPYPFFLDTQYFVNGTYALSASDSGTIIIQGLLLAIAGVVQGLMTTEVVTSYVKTPAHTPSIVWSMGLANLVSGLLGGMGGDAMIGLSTINCLNGGRGRLAPTVTALGVMLCTIVAYPVLDFIPISALAGVMIVVVLHTFKWAKIPIVLSACLPCSWRKPINESMACTPLPKWLRLPLEVDRWEALIIVVVSVLTVAFNLVYGVGVGIALSTLRFAYEASLDTNVVAAPLVAGSDTKRYVLEGRLFFGSAMRFHTFFDVDNDPSEVVLVMAEKPYEYSAQDALARVTGLYAAQKKNFTIEVTGEAGGKGSV